MPPKAFGGPKICGGSDVFFPKGGPCILFMYYNVTRQTDLTKKLIDNLCVCALKQNVLVFFSSLVMWCSFNYKV